MFLSSFNGVLRHSTPNISPNRLHFRHISSVCDSFNNNYTQQPKSYINYNILQKKSQKNRLYIQQYHTNSLIKRHFAIKKKIVPGDHIVSKTGQNKQTNNNNIYKPKISFEESLNKLYKSKSIQNELHLTNTIDLPSGTTINSASKHFKKYFQTPIYRQNKSSINPDQVSLEHNIKPGDAVDHKIPPPSITVTINPEKIFPIGKKNVVEPPYHRLPHIQSKISQIEHQNEDKLLEEFASNSYYVNNTLQQTNSLGAHFDKHNHNLTLPLDQSTLNSLPWKQCMPTQELDHVIKRFYYESTIHIENTQNKAIKYYLTKKRDICIKLSIKLSKILSGNQFAMHEYELRLQNQDYHNKLQFITKNQKLLKKNFPNFTSNSIKKPTIIKKNQSLSKNLTDQYKSLSSNTTQSSKSIPSPKLSSTEQEYYDFLQSYYKNRRISSYFRHFFVACILFFIATRYQVHLRLYHAFPSFFRILFNSPENPYSPTLFLRSIKNIQNQHQNSQQQQQQSNTQCKTISISTTQNIPPSASIQSTTHTITTETIDENSRKTLPPPLETYSSIPSLGKLLVTPALFQQLNPETLRDVSLAKCPSTFSYMESINERLVAIILKHNDLIEEVDTLISTQEKSIQEIRDKLYINETTYQQYLSPGLQTIDTQQQQQQPFSDHENHYPHKLSLNPPHHMTPSFLTHLFSLPFYLSPQQNNSNSENSEISENPSFFKNYLIPNISSYFTSKWYDITQSFVQAQSEYNWSNKQWLQENIHPYLSQQSSSLQRTIASKENNEFITIQPAYISKQQSSTKNMYIYHLQAYKKRLTDNVDLCKQMQQSMHCLMKTLQTIEYELLQPFHYHGSCTTSIWRKIFFDSNYTKLLAYIKSKPIQTTTIVPSLTSSPSSIDTFSNISPNNNINIANYLNFEAYQHKHNTYWTESIISDDSTYQIEYFRTISLFTMLSELDILSSLIDTQLLDKFIEIEPYLSTSHLHQYTTSLSQCISQYNQESKKYQRNMRQINTSHHNNATNNTNTNTSIHTHQTEFITFKQFLEHNFSQQLPLSISSPIDIISLERQNSEYLKPLQLSQNAYQSLQNISSPLLLCNRFDTAFRHRLAAYAPDNVLLYNHLYSPIFSNNIIQNDNNSGVILAPRLFHHIGQDIIYEHNNNNNNNNTQISLQTKKLFDENNSSSSPVFELPKLLNIIRNFHPLFIPHQSFFNSNDNNNNNNDKIYNPNLSVCPNISPNDVIIYDNQHKKIDQDYYFSKLLYKLKSLFLPVNNTQETEDIQVKGQDQAHISSFSVTHPTRTNTQVFGKSVVTEKVTDKTDVTIYH